MPLPLKLSGLCDCFNSWIIVHVTLCQFLSPCPRDWQLYFVFWNTFSWNLKLHVRSMTTLVYYCTVRKPKPCGGIMKDEAIWTVMEIERERWHRETQKENHVWKSRSHLGNRSFNPDTPVDGTCLSLTFFSCSSFLHSYFSLFYHLFSSFSLISLPGFYFQDTKSRSK